MAVNGLMIDFEYCSGCHSCEIACRNEKNLATDDELWGMKLLEYGPVEVSKDNWEWNYIAMPTQICDLCEDRVARGEKPACAQACLAQVIEFGTVDELSKKMNEKGKKAYIVMP